MIKIHGRERNSLSFIHNFNYGYLLGCSPLECKSDNILFSIIEKDTTFSNCTTLLHFSALKKEFVTNKQFFD
jgi:hypothetical protein